MCPSCFNANKCAFVKVMSVMMITMKCDDKACEFKNGLLRPLFLLRSVLG